MKVQWTKGLSKQDKEELKASVQAALPAFERLAEILDEQRTLCETKRRSRTNYLMPGWKEYQADCNGYTRALEEMRNLLSIPDQG